MKKFIFALIFVMFLTFCIGCAYAFEVCSYKNGDILDNQVLSSCFGADGDQNYYVSAFHEYFKSNFLTFNYFPDPCICYNT